MQMTRGTLSAQDGRGPAGQCRDKSSKPHGQQPDVITAGVLSSLWLSPRVALKQRDLHALCVRHLQLGRLEDIPEILCLLLNLAQRVIILDVLALADRILLTPNRLRSTARLWLGDGLLPKSGNASGNLPCMQGLARAGNLLQLPSQVPLPPLHAPTVSPKPRTHRTWHP
eukprot:365028-Chlamydomonas_euryale.AAC.43